MKHRRKQKYTISESRILIIIFITIMVITILLSINFRFYNKETWDGILITFHGVMLEVLIVTVIATWLINREQRKIWEPVIDIGYARCFNLVQRLLVGAIPIDAISQNPVYIFQFGDETVLPVISDDLPLFSTIHCEMKLKLEKLQKGCVAGHDDKVEPIITRILNTVHDTRTDIVQLLNFNLHYTDPKLSKLILKFDTSLQSLQQDWMMKKDTKEFFESLKYSLANSMSNGIEIIKHLRTKDPKPTTYAKWMTDYKITDA